MKELKKQKKTAQKISAEQKRRLKELSGNSGDRKKKLRKDIANKPEAKHSQGTIKYDYMFANGICQISEGVFSKTMWFSDINYKMARKDDQISIFSSYCEMLNSLDSLMFVQLSIVNKRIDESVFRRDMIIPEYIQTKHLNKYRQEFNTMLENKAMEGKNGIIHEKYITFTALADNYDTAVQILARYEVNLRENLQSLGCETKTLSGKERLEIIHDMLNPDDVFNFEYDYLENSSLCTKDYIAPSSFTFFDEGNINTYRFGNKYGQTVFLKNYPPKITDELLTEISNLPINLTISVHINPVDREEAFTYVNTQIAFMEQQQIDEQNKALRQGYSTTLLPYELRQSKSNAEKLREDMQTNSQNLFKVTVLVNTFANTKEDLSENVFKIMAEGKSKNCTFTSLDYIEEEGMNSSLPIGSIV